MKTAIIIIVLAIVVVVALLSVSRLTVKTLKPGNKAPDFSLVGSDGKTYRLSDYKDKQAVVLAWFPKAFTPGCTTECIAFAEGKSKLAQFDVAYFTVSVDPPEKNKEFAASVHADYPILSDPDGTTALAYGVTDAVKKFASRWTFYISRDGRILYIDKDVKPATSVDDAVKKLDELNVARNSVGSSP